ncbi:hypothetical protein OH77DRAFT_1296826 [Trametes cingulata]|nr:hypothetical protein OH77DRAFT_1296826 [Trametes cingulata]
MYVLQATSDKPPRRSSLPHVLSTQSSSDPTLARSGAAGLAPCCDSGSRHLNDHLDHAARRVRVRLLAVCGVCCDRLGRRPWSCACWTCQWQVWHAGLPPPPDRWGRGARWLLAGTLLWTIGRRRRGRYMRFASLRHTVASQHSFVSCRTVTEHEGHSR